MLILKGGAKANIAASQQEGSILGRILSEIRLHRHVCLTVCPVRALATCIFASRPTQLDSNLELLAEVNSHIQQRASLAFNLSVKCLYVLNALQCFPASCQPVELTYNLNMT